MRKVFTNNDFGAQTAIANSPGALISVMQACLVDGYGDQTPTSIVRAGATATMVLPNPHGFTRTGVLNVSGCDQADYNGEFRVTVVDALTVTFTVANSPTSPATGTIVCRQDGAGWTMPFTGTDKAAFKQGASSNGLYLDIDDTSSSMSKVRGYETMSGVGVGVAPFPTPAQELSLYWLKGAATSDWVIVADEHFVIVWTPEGNTQYYTSGMWFFGDYRTTFGINNYGTLLLASISTSTPVGGLAQLDANSSTSTNHRYIARDHTQIGASRQVSLVGNSSMTQGDSFCSAGGSDYPDPLSGNVYMQELAIMATGGSNNLLGHVDGTYSMLHDTPLGNSAINYFGGSGDFLNDEFAYFPAYSNAAVVVRISD